MYYLCIVFFMVLDLRLTMKIGCRDDNLFFFKGLDLCEETVPLPFVWLKNISTLISELSKLRQPTGKS